MEKAGHGTSLMAMVEVVADSEEGAVVVEAEVAATLVGGHLAEVNSEALALRQTRDLTIHLIRSK